MYPRDYFKQQTPIEIGTCFVIMPFAPAFDATFEAIRTSLCKVLGFRVIRTDELLGGANLISEILHGLASSEIVIADLTGKNPNVYYELGLAHMAKPVEKVLLVSQDLADIPFDLRAFRHIEYVPTRRGLQSLSEGLEQSVKAICAPLHRIQLLERESRALAERLLGQDHCLYSFQVSRAILGGGAVKLRLQVNRTAIHRRTETTEVFNGGMGLSYGQSRVVPGTEWTVRLERGVADDSYLRVLPVGLNPQAH